MRVESVAVAYPSRVSSNAEVIALIRSHSSGLFRGDLERTLKRVGRLLERSGAETRRWLAPGERPIDFITTAVHDALRRADVAPAEVDLLIYVGVAKGFVEPAQSYMVAHALGWDRVECFDVLDACMSYARALHLADSMFSTGRYRCVLVVNGEFPLEGGPVYPANFRLETADQLRWTFPSYTIGSAATATLLRADPERRWQWRFKSCPSLADLCTIPSVGWEIYWAGSERIGVNGVHRFTAFGTELHDEAFAPATQVLRECVPRPEDVKLVFSHASSHREWTKFAEAVGMADKLCCVYRELGNVVSASIPAAMAMAIDAGRVRRGDRLVGWVGSAGMSFAAYSFPY